MKIEFEACGNGVVMIRVDGKNKGAVRVGEAGDDEEFVRTMSSYISNWRETKERQEQEQKLGPFVARGGDQL